MNFSIFFFVFLCFSFQNVYSSDLLKLTGECLESIKKKFLASHNEYRAQHGANELIQSSEIVEIAQNYSVYLAANNLFQHSSHESIGLGENLAVLSSSNQPDLTNCGGLADSFVQMWYDEMNAYNFSNPGFYENTGHFTQLVWKSTTELGCGISITTENKIYGVCNYRLPGNYEGQFNDNVSPAS